MSWTWQDTEISIHRSSAHHGTWVANLPWTEINTAIESAGPIRACQRWVLRNAPYYNFDLGDRIRWQRAGHNHWDLWARQED